MLFVSTVNINELFDEEDAEDGLLAQEHEVEYDYDDEDDDAHTSGERSSGGSQPMPCGWKPVDRRLFPMKVTFNDVDTDLLKTTRLIVPKIVNNLKAAVGMRPGGDP